jgi:hypothetical protein
MPRKRKASQRRIDACRANGAKGAGKKSPESRQKCAANSLKHGLCATAASSMLLPSEDAELYNQLLDSYMARYRPQDECERQVLLQIHYAMWRMRRIPTIETTLLHSEIMRINKRTDEENGFKNMGEGFKVGIAFKNHANNDRSFDLLNRYESRIQRSFSRLTQDLNKLQSSRPTSDDGPATTTPQPSTPSAQTEQCKNEANGIPPTSEIPRSKTAALATVAFLIISLAFHTVFPLVSHETMRHRW